MLPASNRISGSSFAFPDTCKTPQPTGPPVEIHYPNTAQNSSASTFAQRVIICGGNALNLASTIAVTSGDEAGVAHQTFTGPASFLTGSPKVMIEGTPAVHLQSVTYQNRYNANGTQIVPSATNVFYGYVQNEPLRGVTAEDALEMAETLHAPEGKLSARLLDERMGWLTIPIFASDIAARASAAIARLCSQGAREFVLDLRGNPGGDVLAAIDLASEFLPEGTVIARLIDGDGDETEYRSFNPNPCPLPMTVFVDGHTASAAEIVAGALRAHGRAEVRGGPTYGKNVVQTFVGSLEGPTYATVARVVLSEEAKIQWTGNTINIE